MKNAVFVIAIILFSLVSLKAQQNCLNPESLASLDASWEKALLTSDVDQLDALLAEDFIWVHNHASLIDSKSMLLNRAADPKAGATGNTRSRKQQEVQVIIKGSTGVVTGITIVDRGPVPTTYHFMRTYVAHEGKCLLLANHTMAVPEGEE